jgi:hypothetical protein
MMTFGEFLVGLLATALVTAALYVGARRITRALLPAWRGSPARLVEITVVLSTLFAVAQVLGAVHLLRPIPVFLAELAAGALLATVAARLPAHESTAFVPSRAAADRREVVVAVVAVAAVVFQWVTHVAFAYSHGMTHGDSLWYHAPFAARFVQHDSFNSLDGVGLEAARFYPLNGSLSHALGMLAFRSDFLSPLLNLGWMLLTLLAAWCIGRRAGVAHLSMLGATAAIGLPMITATQPGQAATDIGSIALLLTGVALLLESERRAAPVGMAGLAIGLALSTKLTIAVPIAVLAVGVAVLTWRAGRRAATVVWLVALVATGGFWFVRNVALTGSPLPWYDLRFGPLHLPVREGAAASVSGQPPLSRALTSGDAWRDIYLPGLRQSLGRAWPLIVVLLVASTVLLVGRGRDAWHRLIGVAMAVAIVAYVFTPYTGGINFFSGLRFLCPMMVIGFALAPLLLPDGTRWRRGLLVLWIAVIAVSVTTPNVEGVPAWPTDRLLVSAVAIAVVLALVVFVGRSRGSVAAGAVIVTALVVIGGGWSVERYYSEHRYVDAGFTNDAINEYFRGVRDSSVAVFGTDETYPLDGLDVSNEVRRGDDPALDVGTNACAAWRLRLSGSDYVAITPPPAFGLYPVPPPEVFDSPNAVVVFDDGAGRIYRLTGPLDPAACVSGA